MAAANASRGVQKSPVALCVAPASHPVLVPQSDPALMAAAANHIPIETRAAEAGKAVRSTAPVLGRRRCSLGQAEIAMTRGASAKRRRIPNGPGFCGTALRRHRPSTHCHRRPPPRRKALNPVVAASVADLRCGGGARGRGPCRVQAASPSAAAFRKGRAGRALPRAFLSPWCRRVTVLTRERHVRVR